MRAVNVDLDDSTKQARLHAPILDQVKAAAWSEMVLVVVAVVVVVIRRR